MQERTERRLRDMQEARRVELEPEPEPEPEQESQPQPQPQPLAVVSGAYKSGDALFHDSLTPCTVLSVHVDPSGGPDYYTVRMSDSGNERQTLASRLSRSRRDFLDGDVCTTERHDAPVVVLGYEEGLYVVGVFDGERQSVERIEGGDMTIYMTKAQQEGGGVEGQGAEVHGGEDDQGGDYPVVDDYPIDDDYPVDDDYPGDDSYPVDDSYPDDPPSQPPSAPSAGAPPSVAPVPDAPLPKSKVSASTRAFKPRPKSTAKRGQAAAPAAGKPRAKKRKAEDSEADGGKKRGGGDEVNDFLNEIEGL